jgi:hypothetical protein
MNINAEPANDDPEANGENNKPDIAPLSRQHSAVLDQSRTSPRGGAIAPSLTDLARRASADARLGTKEWALQVKQKNDE